MLYSPLHSRHRSARSAEVVVNTFAVRGNGKAAGKRTFEPERGGQDQFYLVRMRLKDACTSAPGQMKQINPHQGHTGCMSRQPALTTAAHAVRQCATGVRSLSGSSISLSFHNCREGYYTFSFDSAKQKEMRAPYSCTCSCSNCPPSIDTFPALLRTRTEC